MGKFDLQWAVKVCMWKHCSCLMKRRCQVTAYQTAVKRHFTTAINVILLLGRKRLMFLNTSSWDSWGFEKLFILTEHPAPFCCVSLSLRLKAGSKKLCEVLQRDANVSFCCPIYTAACVYVLFIHLWLMAELVKHGNKTPAKKKCFSLNAKLKHGYLRSGITNRTNTNKQQQKDWGCQLSGRSGKPVDSRMAGNCSFIQELNTHELENISQGEIRWTDHFSKQTEF